MKSWTNTYHRTMTQDANSQSVLGDFNEQSLEYGGLNARMYRDGERYMISIDYPEGTRAWQVIRTVGSHRYQQYLGQDEGGVLMRLPIAWHIQDAEWFHMNGAFLTPDPESHPCSTQDFDRHVVRWNDNCIFCHNVAANPGQQPHGFQSSVAELGVACEACHGPGGQHIRYNQNPLRRYGLHLGWDAQQHTEADESIVNPARLSAERSADVCGRCHGQRLTDNVGAFLRDGDPFIPGEDLALYSSPLWHDSTLDGQEVFRERFWTDGTPRLTAYEYQGMLQSPCAQAGPKQMTCTSCHGMHEGDPSGQIRPQAKGDGGCNSCHAEEPEHSKHLQVECVDCHMPKVVYGVLAVHRSHRIEVPTMKEMERPNACVLCHADQEQDWASDAFSRLWPNTSSGEADEISPPSSASAVLRLAFSGDPIVRSVAVDALSTTPFFPELGERALLDIMEGDPYPAIRRLAWRAIRMRHPELPFDRFSPEAIDGTRVTMVRSIEHTLKLPAATREWIHTRDTWRRDAAQQAIRIGE